MANSTAEAEALGLAIRMRREELKVSRPDLAAQATLSYPYVYEVERGKKYPSGDALAKLAAALEIDPLELEERSAALLAEKSGLAAPGDRNPTLVTDAGRAALSESAAEEVDRLTAAVIARLEPIVREALSAAIGTRA